MVIVRSRSTTAPRARKYFFPSQTVPTPSNADGGEEWSKSVSAARCIELYTMKWPLLLVKLYKCCDLCKTRSLMLRPSTYSQMVLIILSTPGMLLNLNRSIFSKYIIDSLYQMIQPALLAILMTATNALPRLHRFTSLIEVYPRPDDHIQSILDQFCPKCSPIKLQTEGLPTKSFWTATQVKRGGARNAANACAITENVGAVKTKLALHFSCW